MRAPPLTNEQFRQEIAHHVMTIVRDDDVHRHIRFRKLGTSEMMFELITWPGYLCYTGDMGTFVFQRCHDMFEFFRRNDNSYRIDLRYWAEKVEAADKSDGVQRFCFDTFRAKILDWIAVRADDARSDDPGEHAVFMAAYAELKAAVEEEVLRCDDNEVRAYDAVQEFRHEGDAWQEAFGKKSAFEFEDFWEVDCKEYTHRFLWCCQALAWGIAHYDHSKQPRDVAVSVEACA